jgi:hypothetical protein
MQNRVELTEFTSTTTSIPSSLRFQPVTLLKAISRFCKKRVIVLERQQHALPMAIIT